MLPVLCVIVITNVEFVCDKSQDMRVKPKLRGFMNCSTNQFLLVYNYFIAQGHRHQGRLFFLVVVFCCCFLVEVSQKSRTSDDYTNMTHRVKREMYFSFNLMCPV